LTTFDLSYVNTTTNLTLILAQNFITNLTNLNSNISLLYLDISNNQINNQYNLLPLGNSFPSSLTGLTINANPIVNWSTSFSSATSLKLLDMRNNLLNQSSVDFVLCNLNSLVGAVGGLPTGGKLSLENQTNVTYWLNSSPSGPSNTVGTGLWCKAQLTAAPKSWNVTNA
jgi:hypothetical protein